MKSIEIKNLYYRYSNSKEYVLKNINLEIEKGESIAILGASGAGKSTLLRCINRLVYPKPEKGEILINGIDIIRKRKKELCNLRKKIGTIFQNFSVIDTISVMDCVLAGRLSYNNSLKSFLKIFSEKDKEIVLQNIRRVGLEKYSNKWVGHLSGGEKQRVGIARALSQQPEIILADEPVSNLDPRLMLEIMELIKNICKEDNLTLVCNLHFVGLAKKYADRIIGLKEGRIIFDGTPLELTKEKIEEIYGKKEDKF